VPGAEFRCGRLAALPVPDASVDAAVCALALTHVEDLRQPLRELARVVRPGGRVIVSDVHPESVALGSTPGVRTVGGTPARIASYRHRVGDYVRAALGAGLAIRSLTEITPAPVGAARTATEDLGPWDVWPWSLRDVVPEAAAAASAGVPSLLVLGLDKG